MTKKEATATKKRPVVVTTEYKGVFFGYTDDITGPTIHLERGRNCYSWSNDMRGFSGLAAFGPSPACKVGPTTDITLWGITAVLEVGPDAEKNWLAAKW